jgi:3-hydroxyisobutyrate dehydrogenase
MRDGGPDMTHTTIAVLGTGGMGAGMAHRLLDEGYQVRVWNRTKAKLAPLVERGALAGGTPAEAAEEADAVLVSLATADAVHAALLGPSGAWRTLAAGGVVVDTSTTSAEAAQAIGTAVGTARGRFVEARVLGNPSHARSGELRVLAAGPAEFVAAARPLLDTIGKDVRVLGDWGTAARMKIALNLFLGIQLAGLAEAVDIGEAAGLDRATVLSVLGLGGYSSPAVSFRCRLLQRGQLEPAAFRLDLMSKDLRLAADLARNGAVPAPLSMAAGQRFATEVTSGWGHLDAAAVVLPRGGAASEVQS